MQNCKITFLKDKLIRFNLNENEAKEVIENTLKEWDDDSFDFLSGKDIMPYLMENGIEKDIAFKVMESLRNGVELTPELKVILFENDIPLDFLKKYENTLPSSCIGAYFQNFLKKKVQETIRLSS